MRAPRARVYHLGRKHVERLSRCGTTLNVSPALARGQANSPSLVPPSVVGIEAGGAPRGVDPEHHADQRGEHDGDERPREREAERETDLMRDEDCEKEPENRSEDASDPGERGRL